MKIFSVALNLHDHNTYDGKFHNQIERYTRRKHNIPWHVDVYPHHSEASRMNTNDTKYSINFYNEYFHSNKHEILAFTITTGGIKSLPHHTIPQEFLNWKPNHLWDYKIKNNLYYIDHHQSHATYAYLDSGYNESDILVIDGHGWNYNCIFIDKNGNITDLSNKIGLGILWNFFAKELGFGYLGASKVMGLAAYGRYNEYIHAVIDYYFEHNLNFPNIDLMNIFYQCQPEDIAYTLQYATQELIKKCIYPLKSCDNICIGGGVAYNGYMNEQFTKQYDRVHVSPAPGDEGQSIGTYMHADYTLNTNIHISNVYAGEEYAYIGDNKISITEVASAIAKGKIVGWFQGKAESGHRALGNRSILADPRNPDIKNIINRTIKKREDFRPFAPAVLEEHYKEWFDTNQPSPYMSRIVNVKSNKIPGVTHVDNTSRIQTVNRIQNQKFYDLINEFYKITNIPMLLNTSFNCQEPIVETPEQAIRTFNNTELDLLVINEYAHIKD